MQKNIVRPPAPGLVQGLRVPRRQPVGHHGALGPPRGARRVDDGRDVLGLGRDDRKIGIQAVAQIGQRSAPRLIQGQDMGNTALGGDIAQHALGPRVANHHFGPGVGQKVFHLRLSVGGG